jgi:hypothetical protein
VLWEVLMGRRPRHPVMRPGLSRALLRRLLLRRMLLRGSWSTPAVHQQRSEPIAQHARNGSASTAQQRSDSKSPRESA